MENSTMAEGTDKKRILNLYPETYVFYIAGTNVAFLKADAAYFFLEQSRMYQGDAEQIAPDPAVLHMPLGYLAKDTQVVYGPMPEDKPATWSSSDEPKPEAPRQTTAKKAPKKV